MSVIINEASSYQKKYKCPYCDKRAIKTDLVSHILDNHEDMIPEGYTAARLVFNTVNKKDHGSCIICRGETKWDEDKCRYDRLCGKKSCHDIYVKTAHERTRIDEKLRDPEFQQKMLAGRSISGEYKFSDGGKVSYTGSYEKKLLEFMDKFFKIKSEDIQSPGPTIRYMYKGEEHFWITDFYYIPFNLVFDVKDGGDNPNNREMVEYREKQKAKEKALQKDAKYNYIRLTDNNFEQLISVMLDIKNNMDDQSKPVVHINETCAAIMAALPPANAENVYIVNYLQNNVFANDNRYRQAICRDYMSDMFTVVDGELTKLTVQDMVNMESVHLYKYIPSIDNATYNELLELAEWDTDFYSLLVDKPCGDSLDVAKDPLFEEVLPFSEQLKALSSTIKATILHEANNTVNGIKIPSFELEDCNKDADIGIKYFRDVNGIFVANENTNMRSASYDTIIAIPVSEQKIIRYRII